jgi:transposase
MRLIPPAKPCGRPRSVDRRQALNPIPYVVIGGVEWRMPPTDYPNWQTVYVVSSVATKDGAITPLPSEPDLIRFVQLLPGHALEDHHP